MINFQKIKKYLLNGKKFSFSREYTFYDKKMCRVKKDIFIYYDNKFILEISSYKLDIIQKDPDSTIKNPKIHDILTFDTLLDLMSYLFKNTMFSQSDFHAEFTILRPEVEVEKIKAKLNISRIRGNLTNNKSLSISKNCFFNDEETEFFIALNIYNGKYGVIVMENFRSIDEGLLETDIGYVRNERKSFNNFDDAFDYIIGSTEITENDFSHKFKQKEVK